jgi:hypothetical protein
MALGFSHFEKSLRVIRDYLINMYRKIIYNIRVKGAFNNLRHVRLL